MPALSVRIGAQGVREPLSVALKAEMRQLLTNLMCYNLSCVSEGLKMSTWRLTFDEQAIGAISYVFAQVIFFILIYFILILVGCHHIVAIWGDRFDEQRN